MREKYPNLRHYAKWQDFARLMFLRGSPLLKQYAVRDGGGQGEDAWGRAHVKAVVASVDGFEVYSLSSITGREGGGGGLLDHNPCCQPAAGCKEQVKQLRSAWCDRL